jgi:nucleoside-diphosphate-sugar epimerase
MARATDGTTDSEANRPTVLVTGASGLIGSRLVHELAPDYRVVAMDRAHPGETHPESSVYVPVDLTSDESTDHAMRALVDRCGDTLASVVHLAAYYDFTGAPSPLYRDLTVDGTRRLLRALRRSTKTSQFVFASSLLAMKPAEEGALLTEHSPVQGEWAYPRSKLEAERVIRDERGDIPSVVVRLAGVYDDWGHSPPLTQQIWRIRERKLESVFFPGDRSHGQSFVHLDDAVRALRAIVERRDALPDEECFLVGEPETLAYHDLQARIGEQIHGHRWPTIRIPRFVAKAGAWMKENTPILSDEGFIQPWMIDLADARYPISIQHARERLDWEPRYRLSEKLPEILANLQKDPETWYRENDLPHPDEARSTLTKLAPTGTERIADETAPPPDPPPPPPPMSSPGS